MAGSGSRYSASDDRAGPWNDSRVIVVLVVAGFIIDVEVKVGTVAEAASVDDFALEFENGDAGAVKGDTLGLFPRSELEEDRG